MKPTEQQFGKNKQGNGIPKHTNVADQRCWRAIQQKITDIKRKTEFYSNS